jgi:hypothetical protein
MAGASGRRFQIVFCKSVHTAHHHSPCYFYLHAIKLLSKSGLYRLLCVQIPEYEHILLIVLIQLLYSLHYYNKNCKRWSLQVRKRLVKLVPTDLHPTTTNVSEKKKKNSLIKSVIKTFYLQQIV